MIIGPGGRSSRLEHGGARQEGDEKLFATRLMKCLHMASEFKAIDIRENDKYLADDLPKQLLEHRRHDTLVLEERNLWYNQHRWGQRCRSRL